jgi:hypothetical protein
MDESYIVMFAVILSLVVFGLVCCKCKKVDTFGSVNCTNAPLLSPKMAQGRHGWKNFKSGDTEYIAGSYSPGSVFKCRNPEDCPNITVNGCGGHIKPPLVKENLPLGWGSTMTVTGETCMSGVNGINKMSNRNPYGEIQPNGDQTVGYCVKGIDNCFSD